jgi:hypothetical protein
MRFHKEQRSLKAIPLSQIQVIALWVRHQRLRKQDFGKQAEQKTAGALFDFWQMKTMVKQHKTCGHTHSIDAPANHVYNTASPASRASFN